MNDAYIQLSRKALRQILTDAQQRSKIEACGVLLGSIDTHGNWLVEETQPLRNIAESAAYFEFDPEELLHVELEASYQIVGVYHSHPSGYPVASGTDRQNMQRVNEEQNIPWAWIIVKGPFHQDFMEWAQQQPEEAAIMMIAYHHYVRKGLQHVIIQVEENPQDLNIPGDLNS